MQATRFRLRLWHLIAAVAIEGLIAREVVSVFRNAVGIHYPRHSLLEENTLFLTFLICAMLVAVLGFIAILIWFAGEKET
jgi:hypothetical protein